MKFGFKFTKKEKRRLKAFYSANLQPDIKNMHGIDLQDAMLQALQYEMQHQIDMETIKNIYQG